MWSLGHQFSSLAANLDPLKSNEKAGAPQSCDGRVGSVHADMQPGREPESDRLLLVILRKAKGFPSEKTKQNKKNSWTACLPRILSGLSPPSPSNLPRGHLFLDVAAPYPGSGLCSATETGAILPSSRVLEAPSTLRWSTCSGTRRLAPFAISNLEWVLDLIF